MKYIKGVKNTLNLDEYQEMYRIAESLYCRPKTEITLYINYTKIKKLKLIETRVKFL